MCEARGVILLIEPTRYPDVHPIYDQGWEVQV